MNFIYSIKVEIKVIWNTHALGDRNRDIKSYSERHVRF